MEEVEKRLQKDPPEISEGFFICLGTNHRGMVSP